MEFFIFGMVLLGLAVLHDWTLTVALSGLAALVAYKLRVTGFAAGPGLPGLWAHVAAEWVPLANLALLLVGFAALTRHFEQTGIPDLVPHVLPHDWTGAFLLLVVIFVLSSFLDNIAAALIGGSLALRLFDGKLHPGYVVGIVAAANAGGAGSVIGDTTTTLLWIGGVAPREVAHAYVAAAVALVVCGVPAALQQQRHAGRTATPHPPVVLDWPRAGIVAVVLAAAIAANIAAATRVPWLAARAPVTGLAVWATLLAMAPLRRPDWAALAANVKGTAFLLALVAAASLMPVAALPAPSWPVTLALGGVSAVFDNIPLTALALRQGGYDWGLLAYAVGFGGSLMWFGSSAGVALSVLVPQSRDVTRWATAGWHAALAYLAGFAALLAVLGWHPPLPH